MDPAHSQAQPSLEALFPSSLFGPRPVVILDGGMGTTLQSPPFSLPLDSALWSSELLATEEGRDELRKLHQLWVTSGAELLGSATYQSCLALFLPPSSAGSTYTTSDVNQARETMNSALPLLTSTFTPPVSFPVRTHALAALSLGPFGAVLSPGQEYGGLYPAPFGPSNSPSVISYSPSAASAAPLPSSRISPSSDPAEDTLAAWHLRRLEDFALSPSFESLSISAFETIPVLREARAIRRAVTVFNAGRPSAPPKPFYLSYVFPVNKDGEARFPDAEYTRLSPEEMADKIVEATFGLLEDRFARPQAIGVNCTSPLHLLSVVRSLSEAIARAPPIEDGAPWLVIYPDGGSVYDVVTRTWSNPEGLDPPLWAGKVADVAQFALAARKGAEEPTFAGVIAGGCCKAGPRDIVALRKECMERGLIH